MKLSVSEALGLHELLQGLAAHTETFAVNAEEAHSEELRHLIAEQLDEAQDAYHEIRGIAASLSSGSMMEIGERGWHENTMMKMMSSQGSRPLRPVEPHPTGRMSDRAIATDMLESSKAFAVKCTWVATEMSHQRIRHILADLSRECLDNAFRLYKFMERQGWYPTYKEGDNPEQWLTHTHQPIEGQAQTSRMNHWQA